MIFTKYKKYGAYHWKQYEDGKNPESRNAKYYRHCNRLIDWIKEKNVLDIGAGDGKITSLLKAKGIDSDPDGVRFAQEKGVDVIIGDAYALPFKDKEFDSAFIGDTLEHLAFPAKAIQEARRVIKKYLYVASPIKTVRPEKFHYREWNRSELKEMVEKEGFKLAGKILKVREDKRIYGKFKKS